MSLLAAYLATLTSAPIIQLVPFYLVQDYRFDTQTLNSEAGFQLSNIGIISAFTTRFGDQNLGSWIVPTSVAPGAYEVQLSGLSGDPLTSSSPQNTWIPLNISRGWYLQQVGQGSKSCNFTIEIRLGTTVLATSSVGLEAVVEGLRGDDRDPNIF